MAEKKYNFSIIFKELKNLLNKPKLLDEIEELEEYEEIQRLREIVLDTQEQEQNYLTTT